MFDNEFAEFVGSTPSKILSNGQRVVIVIHASRIKFVKFFGVFVA